VSREASSEAKALRWGAHAKQEIKRPLAEVAKIGAGGVPYVRYSRSGYQYCRIRACFSCLPCDRRPGPASAKVDKEKAEIDLHSGTVRPLPRVNRL